jgi:hypothetical protein
VRATVDGLSKVTGVLSTFTDCMGDLNDHARNVFDSIQPQDRTLCSETLRVLIRYQFDRCLGAYCLIVNGLVWDGEVVLRVAYEAAAKVLFIAAHSDEAREKLVSEYWEELGSIYDRKGADKARLAERFSRRFDADDARIFRHLQNPEIFNLAGSGNKKRRNEVEQRWSFSEIAKELARSSDSHVRVDGFEAMTHIYGMASNLAHASSRALDLMEDRATRADDLHHLEASHICRMLSDMVSLGCFSLAFAARVTTGRLTMSGNLDQIFQNIHQATLQIQEDFDRSQDNYYAKWGL